MSILSALSTGGCLHFRRSISAFQGDNFMFLILVIGMCLRKWVFLKRGDCC